VLARLLEQAAPAGTEQLRTQRSRATGGGVRSSGSSSAAFAISARTSRIL
jgi:hypothetical protein